MKNQTHTEAGYPDGKSYIVGRDGHIKLDDLSASRGHAEIKFINGRIYLRDLSSTNGTYLVKKNDTLVPFEEGFLSPNQLLMIGSHTYTIKSLLANIGIYASYSEQSGLTVKLSNSSQI